MTDDEILLGHIKDLAERSYARGIYTCSGFLREEELSYLLSNEREFGYAGFSVSGGIENASRCVMRFGNPDTTGYDEPFPIACLKIEPLSEKFGEALSHRDYLGALMNLGIERELIGDILIDGKTAYVFCMEHIADFICDGLPRVRHTQVKISVLNEVPENLSPKLESRQIIASSERLDAVIAKLFNLSRTQSQRMFSEKKVFVNGRICEKPDIVCREGDKVSVRGCGKFIYEAAQGVTGKGRQRIAVSVYK